MLSERQRVTLEAYDAFVESVQDDRRFEYIAGEIIEVPTNPLASMIAAQILGEIIIYLKQNNIGRVTGADGGYMVGEERYIPDVGFIKFEKLPDSLGTGGYIPAAPDLAVEVVSDESSGREMETLLVKLSNYAAAGTLVWVVYPQSQMLRVHAPVQPVRTLVRADTLDGGDVLPGFTLALGEMFAQR